ncbi:hypothetical protein NUW54_g14500 [Trametes sanguinea]|uniref:Uncharacterized protein n=1 Tax=Trametes sanguinea TaxID=158606 RepID=A0ACC1MCX7_9APHY|nr:hypothetical protein NUW54_g14500 [Trametes sanguinea]
MLEHVPFAMQAPSGGSRTDAANPLSAPSDLSIFDSHTIRYLQISTQSFSSVLDCLERNNVVPLSSLPRHGLDFSIACAHTVVPRLGELQKMFIAIRRLFRKDKADARRHAAPSLASISTTSTATPSGNEKDTDGPAKTPQPSLGRVRST